LGGLAIAVVYLSGPIMQNVILGVSVIALCTALLLYGLKNHVNESKIKVNYFSVTIRWFGRRSYELYLFHIVVLGIMREYFSGNAMSLREKPIWLLFFILMSVIISEIIFKYYSEPLNSMLRKWIPRRLPKIIIE